MAPIRRVATIQWQIKVRALHPPSDMMTSMLTELQELGIEDNHATACKYIREAAAQGAELAVLPE